VGADISEEHTASMFRGVKVVCCPTTTATQSHNPKHLMLSELEGTAEESLMTSFVVLLLLSSKNCNEPQIRLAACSGQT
jgi:hypothetical protein